ncbi:DUF3035 domain-containing protein [Candidatus Pelagibacter sp.]|jgi:PBP1b-binding outer membrane lipoprotein LpoB|nr:DUF3035 domain-containing protein [Candidatus Pelagibacter sp.]|tara:strand:+ start:41 stop:361 length:321 start_codon:yes stop_codon:yes gene_type:complete
MKSIKYINIILLLTVFITGCTSIKNTLTGVPKESTDEFFVKKKNPLVLPPDFDNLPKPQTKTIEDNAENKNIDLSSVLKKSKDKKQTITKESNTLQKSISNILNNK